MVSSTQVSQHSHERARKRGGVPAVLVAATCWSFGSVLGKSTHASGVVLSFWRLWIASGVLLVLVAITGRWPRLADFKRTALAGVLFGLNICAFFVALETVTIATALIIAALAPVVALPVSVLLFGERPTAIKLICAIVSVAGVVIAVIVAPSDDAGTTNTVAGYLWALLALGFWVTYLLVSKGVRRKVETVRFMFVVSFVGALTLSVLVAIGGHHLGEIHGAGWAWVTMLAIGPGVAGHGLVAWAQPRVEASVTSVLIQWEPVAASVWAWWILGERVSLAQAVAMSGVIVALSVLAYTETREGTIEIVDAVS